MLLYSFALALLSVIIWPYHEGIGGVLAFFAGILLVNDAVGD